MVVCIIYTLLNVRHFWHDEIYIFFFHEYRNVNDLSNSDSHGYGSIDLGLGGSYSSSYGSASCLTIDICPDLLFAGLAAAAAAGFAFYYISITMAGKRRKRRSFGIGTTFHTTLSFARGNDI